MGNKASKEEQKGVIHSDSKKKYEKGNEIISSVMTILTLKQNVMSKNIVKEYHIDNLTEFENYVMYKNYLYGKTM